MSPGSQAVTSTAVALLIALSGLAPGRSSGVPYPCTVFKTITGDLGAAAGGRLRVHYCQRREQNEGGEASYRNGFFITAHHGNIVGSVLAPQRTTWRIRDPRQPLDRLWPVAGGALITLLVMHGARTMDFHVYRFTHSAIREVGTWRGAADIDMSVMGTRRRLTVIASQPDRAQLPDVSVWNGIRFVAADKRFPDVLQAVGERWAQPVLAGSPLPPFGCSTGAPSHFRHFQQPANLCAEGVFAGLLSTGWKHVRASRRAFPARVPNTSINGSRAHRRKLRTCLPRDAHDDFSVILPPPDLALTCL